ncbi:unnamed protein product [Lathyrus oleraceus]
MDDINFRSGYPKSFKELASSRIMENVSSSEHTHLGCQVIAPIVGHKELKIFIECMEDIVVTLLEELSSMKHHVKLLKEKARKKIVKILQHVMRERRLIIKNGQHVRKNKDLMDILLDLKDDNGRNLEDKISVTY